MGDFTIRTFDNLLKAFNTESSIKQYTVIDFRPRNWLIFRQLGFWLANWQLSSHIFLTVCHSRTCCFLHMHSTYWTTGYRCSLHFSQVWWIQYDLLLGSLTDHFSGLTSSTIATVGNVALFDIWSAKEERKKQGSLVQAAHGMYAFGGVLSG